MIDDMDASATVGDTDVACDSLGNVCVAWDGIPTTANLGTNLNQNFSVSVTARVFHFDGKKVTPLTHTFFPFVNHETDTNAIQGFTFSYPNVDMTTKYICVAAKGTISSTNNPAGPLDSAPLTTLYTIINNPGWVVGSENAIADLHAKRWSSLMVGSKGEHVIRAAASFRVARIRSLVAGLREGTFRREG
jgi:hypothetical protein